MRKATPKQREQHRKEAITELDKMEQQVQERNWNKARFYHDRASKLMKKI